MNSSKLSFKAVLFYNVNQIPCISIGQSVHIKKTFDNIKLLLESIENGKHQWHICGGLKALSILLCMQLGYTNIVVSFMNGITEFGLNIIIEKYSR